MSMAGYLPSSITAVLITKTHPNDRSANRSGESLFLSQLIVNVIHFFLSTDSWGVESHLPARSVLLLRRGVHWTPAPPNPTRTTRPGPRQELKPLHPHILIGYFSQKAVCFLSGISVIHQSFCKARSGHQMCSAYLLCA